MLLKLLKIDGHSMEPAIKNGSVVVASSIPFMFRSPKKNDIVAFKFGNKIFIKRISSVSKDMYYLEGDNKEDSLDSRRMGWINRKSITGEVLCIIS